MEWQRFAPVIFFCAAVSMRGSLANVAETAARSRGTPNPRARHEQRPWRAYGDRPS